MTQRVRSALPGARTAAAALGVLALVFSSVAQGEELDPVLESYIEVWNTGEVDRLEELVAPGFRRHAGPDESVDSIAALADLITNTQSIYDPLEISIDDATRTSDRAAFRGRFYGVHKAVNGVIEFPLMAIYRYADDRIAEEWILGNNFLSLIVLGYELVPPGFEALPPEPESLQLERAQP